MTDLLARPLVIGASGQLGSDLVRTLADTKVVGLDHRAIEIESPASIVAALRLYRPSVVINTAAFHNVDQCEQRADRAFAVNALAVDSLASLCALAACALVHVSTDYVFEGNASRPYVESDSARPVNAYGASKLAGELLALRHGPAFVVRTSGLFGRAGSSTKGYTFVDRVLTQAREGREVRVVTDVTFSPSYTLHVAGAIRRILERGTPGTFHVTNAGACTWFEFASAAFDLAGVTASIVPTTAAAFASVARRPKYSALAHATMEGLGLAAMPDWRDGLSAYLAERNAG